MSKVLVVDDDSNFRGIIERVILRSYTYAVRGVATEAEAWNELTRESYDLVVLDLYLDGKKSWDTLKRIRKLPSGPPVLMVTCEDTKENLEYAKSLGAVGLIPKPIDFGTLKTTIDRNLVRHGNSMHPGREVVAAGKGGGSEMMRILIIHGDKKIRESLRDALPPPDFQTLDAGDADTARTSLRKEIFDAVLTEVKGSGEEAALAMKTVREVESPSFRVPVVAVTDGGAESILTALRAGADDYIIPPIEPQLLTGKVEAHIRMRKEFDRRIEQVISLCVKDAVTGSYNHAYFRSRLQEEFDRSQRYDRNLSLALIGLENLGRMRTVHGPAAADRILSEVSNVIRKTIRSSDVMARHGEEDFALLMPEATADRVLRKAGAIRARVEESLALMEWKGTGITCSVGLASHPLVSADAGSSEPVKSAEDLLGMANMALTRARGSGKDRVAVFGA
jgi:two-component system cell cycle response regulator